VFIDTNSLLDFYRLSGGDLDEVQKLIKLGDSSKINLLVSDHVRDEFFRNREKVIAEALREFDKSKCELHQPNLVRVHGQCAELDRLKAEFEKKKKELRAKVSAEALSSKTKADQVIADLFSGTVAIVPKGVYDKAEDRHGLGKPLASRTLGVTQSIGNGCLRR
jgi:hypothetical protein